METVMIIALKDYNSAEYIPPMYILDNISHIY